MPAPVPPAFLPLRSGRTVLALLASVLLVLGAACSSGPAALAASTASAPPTVRPGTAVAPGLEHLGPCADPALASFSCGLLRVPLDHERTAGATLALPVTVQKGPASDPVLLNLTGGPGQPGVAFAPRFAQRLAPALNGRRLVMLDQRGTGATAISCPGLQREMGEGDLLTPTAASVRECSGILGATRPFYGTQDTVQDLELLRRALRVRTMTVDGTSYGSYVAERYAVTYPHAVDHLILDSVVPHQWMPQDSLSLTSMVAVRRVLRDVCTAQQCPGDPVADLATLVSRGYDGPALLNLLAIVSVIRPSFDFVPGMLHDAVNGNDGLLQGWLQGVAAEAPVAEFSQGLHAATLCMDQVEPWGDSDTPFVAREAALQRVRSTLTAQQVYPFDVDTATDNGLVQLCRSWDVTTPDRVSHKRNLPPVPTLFLAGDRDLSTPLEWASREFRRAPHGEVLVVRGAGHSLQSRGAEHPEIIERVTAFLGRP
ncbi:alpha/beta hydrolase [Luteipulveratus sp. YIM 133132]|uniref:alpha/beta fold hydrolase n=1 Tax=Luteipulveratus flavus TaxID=3031728 RepID=UPI0023B0FD1C|nr:alpha/beta hydrolase [Luteipulveratus sp. YIM 133132]MDE9365784.1 alpha/beta hydrolase [Luteipulveratus sp. YIM 133132]